VTTTIPSPPTPPEARPPARRAVVALAAIVAAVMVGIVTLFSGPAASAAPLLHAGNGVGVFQIADGQRVGFHETVLAGQGRARASNYDRMAVGSGVGAESGTTIYRGVAEDHQFFSEAEQGIARPGDPLGHADPVLHNQGFTYNSRLTSWSTDRSVAEQFAGKNGVILRTTIEEMQAQGVNILASPDAYSESEVLLEGIIPGLPVELP
jgi:hypothetical protein